MGQRKRRPTRNWRIKESRERHAELRRVSAAALDDRATRGGRNAGRVRRRHESQPRGDFGRRLFAWGSAAHGKLGLGGDTGSVLLPTEVTALAHVKIESAACGDNHSVALDSDGNIFTWGFNGSFFAGGGMLGHGTRDTVAMPKWVESLDEEAIQVKTVTAGELQRRYSRPTAK